MRNPTVSVIIPVFNRANTVGRAIASVLGQTYRDFELIVVDDASCDGTAAAIRAFRDRRIVFMSHKANQGAPAARNTGLSVARGEYIAFLDSDDEWLPSKLEKQVDLFNAVSSETGLVYTGTYRVEESGRASYHRPQYRGYVFERLLVKNIIMGSTSGAMIRSEVFRKVGWFDETLPAMQDVDYWLRVARYFAVDYVCDPLIKVHVGENSQRISCDKEAISRGRAMFFEKYKDELERTGLLHEYFCGTGLLYQGHIGDVGKAREWYLKSIKKYPANLVAYVYLLSTFAPLPLYTIAVRVKGAMGNLRLRFMGLGLDLWA